MGRIYNRESKGGSKDEREGREKVKRRRVRKRETGMTKEDEENKTIYSSEASSASKESSDILIKSLKTFLTPSKCNYGKLRR